MPWKGRLAGKENSTYLVIPRSFPSFGLESVPEAAVLTAASHIWFNPLGQEASGLTAHQTPEECFQNADD